MFFIPVALTDQPRNLILSGVVWLVIAGLLTWRYRSRGKRNDPPPPWVV